MSDIANRIQEAQLIEGGPEEVKEKPQDTIVLLKHDSLGYFTGVGWSAHKADAKRMNHAAAQSWINIFLEVKHDGVMFEKNSNRIIPEASAEDTVPCCPTTVFTPAYDVRTDWSWGWPDTID